MNLGAYAPSDQGIYVLSAQNIEERKQKPSYNRRIKGSVGKVVLQNISD